MKVALTRSSFQTLYFQFITIIAEQVEHSSGQFRHEDRSCFADMQKNCGCSSSNTGGLHAGGGFMRSKWS